MQGRQVKDQEWKAGNLALRFSVETKMPVRVMRGQKQTGKPHYSYEGLYVVTEYKMEASSHGPKVIRFKLEAVPGESTARSVCLLLYDEKVYK